jgi:hypothetical protein
MLQKFQHSQSLVIARIKGAGIELQAYFEDSTGKRKPIFGKQAVIAPDAWDQRPQDSDAIAWAFETCGIFDHVTN